MNDPGLNSLLKWSVENSSSSQTDNPDAQSSDPRRGLDAEALARLMGGPSDADRMKEAMAAIQSPEVDLDNKIVAFDNFEQLVENLDNANNMESLGLWRPLVDQLDQTESELQRMAAWCIGTAVQNNIQAQKMCLEIGAIPKLLHLCLNGPNAATKKKAAFALSSEVRNYQPGLEELINSLPLEYRGEDKLDATDMDAVDVVITRLRQSIHQ